MFLFNDGSYTIYVPQHKDTDSNKWHFSSLDHFGHPAGLTASNKCWQTTGIMGTFDRTVMRRAIKWLKNKHPTVEFRMATLVVSQQTII